MLYFQEEIKKVIQQQYTDLEVIFSASPNVETGHLSIPCFSFSKILRRSPKDIADDLSELIQSLDFIDKVESTGGYINCFIKKEILFRTIITEVLKLKESYGSNQSGHNKTALIEHTSINPNASPHVGRARNAMIGDSIVRLLKFEGYKVEVHYFVNDIGKQIAMLLLGAMKKESVSFKDLLDLYIDINNELKENPELENEIFSLLYKLENGDEEVRTQFRNLVNICINGQTSILKELGIEYDAFDYESDYLFNERLNDILEELKNTGDLEEDSEGRYVLNQSKYNLPMKAPYLVLTRKDKTSLYPLRDIAYTIDKVKKNHDRNIIVLGEDQKLYFKQIAAVLDLLGLTPPEVIHYSIVLLAEGKMATRNGTVILLEDFMKEAYEKAKTEIQKRRDSVDETSAKAIAYGAVKYSIIKTSNDKNVTFDWDSALSFEGDSGPYLQYSLARIFSILRNFTDTEIKNPDYSLLDQKEELELILEIARMNEVIELASKNLSPHIIANYLYGLTQKFSRFYHQHSIINASSEELKIARLHLILAVKQVILNCLSILGIDSVETM
ncbi:arginine--tRNA ligase [Clostridium sp. Marseille-P299]|uniref:arginine--tRNA ligase n=1 Tax=Clostridium sp. Marseille-P299 TaxID=1805477 RepID=UPI0008340512|nr:arginine--tRNA ligase [Clostridium sp. Marseille-P299]